MLTGLEAYNYFINCTALIVFPMKIRKMADRYLYTNSIDLEELKAQANNENTNKSTKSWLKVWEDWALVRQYNAKIENYPPEM